LEKKKKKVGEKGRGGQTMAATIGERLEGGSETVLSKKSREKHPSKGKGREDRSRGQRQTNNEASHRTNCRRYNLDWDKNSERGLGCLHIGHDRPLKEGNLRVKGYGNQ